MNGKWLLISPQSTQRILRVLRKIKKYLLFIELQISLCSLHTLCSLCSLWLKKYKKFREPLLQKNRTAFLAKYLLFFYAIRQKLKKREPRWKLQWNQHI